MAPPQPRLRTPEVLPLENGDMLTLAEFMRRYEQMHHVKKAELIEGTVYMPSPVRADHHAKLDGFIHSWLFNYSAMHELEFYPNATLLLDSDNAFQPDSMLCSKPRKGGRVWLNDKGYLCGSPELVVEVAASSATIDLRDKLRVYRRRGVSEYIVWRTADKAVDWFVLEEGEYIPMTAGKDHKLRSKIFHGLVLDVEALLALDGAKVLAAIEKS